MCEMTVSVWTNIQLMLFLMQFVITTNKRVCVCVCMCEDNVCHYRFSLSSNASLLSRLNIDYIFPNE